MCGQVIRHASADVDAGQCSLVIEQERLVARVELDPVELLRVSPARLHEGERTVDFPGKLLVALPSRALRYEVLIPALRLVQVGESAVRERSAKVQGHGRAVVRLEQP